MQTSQPDLALNSALAEVVQLVHRLPAAVVVSRLAAPPHRAPCGLCWVGPGPVAGIVRERSLAESEPIPICSRCLVTLELLAAQFGTDLRLQLDTRA